MPFNSSTVKEPATSPGRPVSRAQVARLFGFTDARSFQSSAAPKLGLRATKKGSRWYFDSNDVALAMIALEVMQEAKGTLETWRPSAQFIRATDVAIQAGYRDASHFRAKIAPKLGLRAVRIGRTFWFPSSAVAVLAKARREAGALVGEPFTPETK